MLPFNQIAIHEHSISGIKQILNWGHLAVQKGADALLFRGITSKTLAQLVTRPFGEFTNLKIGVYALQPVLNVDFYHVKSNITSKPDLNGWVGKSCHNLAEVEAAKQQGYDYVFLSPIFPTASHPEAVPLGLDYLKMVCDTVKIPVFALGGVNAACKSVCLQAGAAGVAGIRLFL